MKPFSTVFEQFPNNDKLTYKSYDLLVNKNKLYAERSVYIIKKENYVAIGQPYVYENGSTKILVSSFANADSKYTVEDIILRMIETQIMNERQAAANE